MNLKIYGDSISGNCLKVKWTAERLNRAYDWVETSALSGETRQPRESCAFIPRPEW